MSKNPARDGLAAFVDVFLIWTLGMANHVDSTQWLNEKHHLNSIRLKGGVLDIGYAHSLSTRYPSQFMEKDKQVMTSTTTIKML
jgi:hypothetical protein